MSKIETARRIVTLISMVLVTLPLIGLVALLAFWGTYYGIAGVDIGNDFPVNRYVAGCFGTAGIGVGLLLVAAVLYLLEEEW